MIVKPGIYKRDAIDYDAIQAVNQSTLKRIAKSPLHYRHALEHPPTSTDPMKLGSLADTLLFEPHRFELDYAVWDPGEGKPDTRSGKAWEAFKSAHESQVIVRRRDVAAAERMVEEIRKSKLAMRYLQRGFAQPILVWHDKETGLLCKARLDFISHAVADVMCELKTAHDVAPWAFESAFAKRAYDVQVSFYSDGYEAITGRPLYGKCIAVENVEPHDVIVYDLNEVTDVGRELYREMLATLVDCQKSGLWLGQATLQERTLRLPKWRDPEDQDDLNGLGLEFDQ